MITHNLWSYIRYWPASVFGWLLTSLSLYLPVGLYDILVYSHQRLRFLKKFTVARIANELLINAVYLNSIQYHCSTQCNFYINIPSFLV